MVAVAALGTAAPKPKKTAKTPLRKVTDIRFWTAGDTTRVAIEVSGEFKYTAQRLSGPDRVFFDIENSRLALKPKTPTTIRVADGLVQQVRLAERKPDFIRVVLDLEDGVDYTVSRLSNPERLMVELSSKKPRPASSKKTTTSRSTAPQVTTPQATPPESAPAPPAPPASPARNVLIPPVFASISGNTAPNTVAGKVVAPPARPIAPIVEVAPPKEVLPKDVKEEVPLPLPDVNLIAPQAAGRNSNGELSLTRALGLKLGRVVLDAGHGGHDQGTHSKAGLLEKDLVLDITQRLAGMLRERMGIDVVLTRSDDTFLSLEERTRLANERKADLFLSIHANSSPVKSVAGVETFYLNFSAGKDDGDLAARENAASQRSIAELKEVVSQVVLRAKVDESREFAMSIQKSLQSTAFQQNKEAKDRGVKRAPFVVLIGAEMPSVLAEIGFLSNSRDEALLKGAEHRNSIAEALYQGIAGYADSLSRSTQVAKAAAK